MPRFVHLNLPVIRSMPIDRKLLEILVCPITKQSVNILSPSKLGYLNQQIESGAVTNHAGVKLEAAIGEALITHNGETIYPVDAGIPVMLEDESIATVQFSDWPG